jgi:sugar phosphate isomerase/epimerase
VLVTDLLTRRQFLARAGAGVALAAAPRTATSAEGMYVSLNGSLTRAMEWEEFARLASRVGYRGVDVNLKGARTRGADATKKLLSELRLQPAVTNLPVPLGAPDATYQESFEALGAAAAFAAAIGCPRMMAVLSPSSARPKQEQRKLVADRVTAIAGVLSRANIRLGLEFLGPRYFRTRGPHEFIWRMDETVELATECGPNVGVVLDAWHWHHAGATVNDILAAGRSRIVHVHVSDAKPQPPDEVRDNHRVMPGEGVIDLVGFFQALAKIGYTGGVSPEPLGRVPSDMSPEDGARLGLETTVAMMKKAGIDARSAPPPPSREALRRDSP